MHTQDHRLERLYDYTKFHIGIYIAAGTTMITIAGSQDLSPFLNGLIKNALMLHGAIAAMLVSGAAGGIIISSCATAGTLDEIWNRKIGFWAMKLMPGRFWAGLEHFAFWLSVCLFAGAVLVTP